MIPKNLTDDNGPCSPGGKLSITRFAPAGMRRRRGAAPGSCAPARRQPARAAPGATGYPRVFPRRLSTAVRQRGPGRVLRTRSTVHARGVSTAIA